MRNCARPYIYELKCGAVSGSVQSFGLGDVYISFNHNFRKIFFSARIVNIWNSLPNYVVDVQSVDVFKVHVDQFWAQQEVMFDWTADLTGTGDRSEYTVESN